MVVRASGGGGSSSVDYTGKVASGWTDYTCGFQPKHVFLNYFDSGNLDTIYYDVENNQVYRMSSGNSFAKDNVSATWIYNPLTSSGRLKTILNGISVYFGSATSVIVEFIGQ